MFTHESAKFLGNFDPENSERVRRKRNRGIYENDSSGGQSVAIYDDHGIHIKTGGDLCDCLRRQCPGCHFECKKCKSHKCGQTCRVNRSWEYDSVNIQAIDKREFEKTRRNPYLDPPN
ncbi:ARL14 effector protein-like [Brevipalpus obovatus]|uniref:ARL14 effector protein-like n=1 Tax=Brevipalpus obovatus TaxID=246614 RepID=UPI003D9FA050